MEDDLRNYKLQLQQVEAALTTDPANEELIKLKGDLEEVIDLTQDLLRAQQEDVAARQRYAEAGVDDVTASLLVAEQELGSQNRINKRKKWKIGDKCMAKWAQDGQYYEAVIHELVDNVAKVLFPEYSQLQTCPTDEFKEVQIAIKRPAEDSGDEASKHGKPHNRDYLKKKKQKKQQRYKQIEEERETEKNKWLSFSAKSSKKGNSSGNSSKAKSIFASPDNVNGRVGIGTCGISGKPMTEFSHGEMWRKGA